MTECKIGSLLQRKSSYRNDAKKHLIGGMVHAGQPTAAGLRLSEEQTVLCRSNEANMTQMFAAWLHSKT